MSLVSKGLKVSFHVFKEGFHFNIDNGIDGGIEGNNIGIDLFNFNMFLG